MVREPSSPRLSERRFREFVAEALDDLPDEWGELLDNVAIVVENEPSAEDLQDPAISWILLIHTEYLE